MLYSLHLNIMWLRKHDYVWFIVYNPYCHLKRIYIFILFPNVVINKMMDLEVKWAFQMFYPEVALVYTSK